KFIRTTNPLPLGSSFDTIERLANQPPPLLIMEPPIHKPPRLILLSSCLFSCLLSSIELANVAEALRDADWVSGMQEELDQFARLKV
nr:hypothetical protein [Tanacetum cinerariifolium]